MGFEFVDFSSKDLLTHQDLSILAENDNFFKTAWANYKRPKLKFVNANIVTVEENTGIAEESKFFDDLGEVFFSNGSDLSPERGCDLTVTLDFTSTAPKSGLHSSYTLTQNSWYHIYAVKTTFAGQSGKFVLAAEETPPMRGPDVVTLNNNLGGFGNYYYLGTIRYGDSVLSPSGILDFVMNGDITIFKNTVTGNAGIQTTGIQLATGASTNDLTYTYASGRGDLQIPINLDHAIYNPCFENSLDQILIEDQSTETRIGASIGGYNQHFDYPSQFGMRARTLSVKGVDIFLSGFHDGFFQPDHNKILY